MNNGEQKISIWTIIMFLWFGISIVLIVTFAEKKDFENMWLVVGQYIVGFGLMFLSPTKKNNNYMELNKKDNPNVILQNEMTLVKQEDDSYVVMPGITVDSNKFRKSQIRLGYFLLLGGISFIVCVYLAFHPKLLGLEVNWQLLFYLFLISVMAIYSFRNCYKTIKKYRYLKERCFMEVVAVISKYVKKHRGIQYPVYKFMFNGKTYFIFHNVGSRRILKPIGSEIRLMINPSMPYEYRTSRLTDGLLKLFVCAPMFIFSFLSLILFIIKFGKDIF